MLEVILNFLILDYVLDWKNLIEQTFTEILVKRNHQILVSLIVFIIIEIFYFNIIFLIRKVI